jgi:[acyl-carrier-protein] S-malonyltransferase
MGKPWRDTPSWAVVERLSAAAGRDLATLLLDADAETIQATANAQPATFALSLVVLDAVRTGGMTPPVAVAGHSLGEYTALVAADVLEEAEGIRLVEQRAQAMQTAADARPGTMAAVLGLDPDAVARVCAAQVEQEAWVANDNAPGQVVIAGTVDGVARTAEAAKAAGASRVMPLAVGGAFHSPLMAPAQDRLDAAVARAALVPGRVPVVANVDAEAHDDADGWRARLSAQLCQPVRWRQSMERLAAMGITTFVELGPGDALTGMVKRTVPTAGRHRAATPEQVEAALGPLQA